jgi:signal peptidase II
MSDVTAGAPEPFVPAAPAPEAPMPPELRDAQIRLAVVPGAVPRPRRRLGVLLAVAVVAYLADVIAKIVVVATMTEGETGRSFGIVTLRLIRNPGAAFGLGVGVTAVFTAISALVVLAILRTSRRLGSLPWAVTLGLLLGGALGNLTDRIIRHPSPFRGYVIDFIELPGWPIFNLADSCICAAGAMMVYLAFRNVPLEGGAARP